jgi:hypothetical protein
MCMSYRGDMSCVRDMTRAMHACAFHRLAMPKDVCIIHNREREREIHAHAEIHTHTHLPARALGVTHASWCPTCHRDSDSAGHYIDRRHDSSYTDMRHDSADTDLSHGAPPVEEIQK